MKLDFTVPKLDFNVPNFRNIFILGLLAMTAVLILVMGYLTMRISTASSVYSTIAPILDNAMPANVKWSYGSAYSNILTGKIYVFDFKLRTVGEKDEIIIDKIITQKIKDSDNILSSSIALKGVHGSNSSMSVNIGSLALKKFSVSKAAMGQNRSMLSSIGSAQVNDVVLKLSNELEIQIKDFKFIGPLIADKLNGATTNGKVSGLAIINKNGEKTEIYKVKTLTYSNSYSPNDVKSKAVIKGDLFNISFEMGLYDIDVAQYIVRPIIFSFNNILASGATVSNLAIEYTDKSLVKVFSDNHVELKSQILSSLENESVSGSFDDSEKDILKYLIEFIDDPDKIKITLNADTTIKLSLNGIFNSASLMVTINDHEPKEMRTFGSGSTETYSGETIDEGDSGEDDDYESYNNGESEQQGEYYRNQSTGDIYEQYESDTHDLMWQYK